MRGGEGVLRAEVNLGAILQLERNELEIGVLVEHGRDVVGQLRVVDLVDIEVDDPGIAWPEAQAEADHVGDVQIGAHEHSVCRTNRAGSGAAS